MGIMHRDVKPHNVMIDHDQRKVITMQSEQSQINITFKINHPGVEWIAQPCSQLIGHIWRSCELIV